jgi:hypothetical protein
MHSSISVAHEGMFLINLYFKYRNKQWDKKTIYQFLDDVFLENKMHLWDLDRDYILKDLLSSSPLTYQRVCQTIYRAVDKLRANSRLGDKNPHYSFFIPRLLKIFPDAQFIFLIRDYRDNVLSYSGVHFDLNNTVALAYRWLQFNRSVEKFRQLFPDRFLVITYERLINKPEPTLSEICSFLGLSFESKMVNFFENRQDIASSRKWHQKLNMPLDKKNVNKWQQAMPLKKLCEVESVCAKFAQKFGYTRSTPKNVFFLKLWYGKMLAYLYLLMERLYFYFPLKIRILLINGLRKKYFITNQQKS